MLRREIVALLADADVVIDAEEFRRSGAVRPGPVGPPAAAQPRSTVYTGPLLPDDLYEPWVEEAAERFAALHLDLLRLAGRWEDVLVDGPC